MENITDFFDSFYRGSKNPSLDVMKYFMNKYDNFESKMKFIHIAGTNGKGSCTEIISNILIKQGYKVGKFLSPHLVKYNERISINGIEISNEEILNYIDELMPLINEYNSRGEQKVSFFEIITIIGFLYFYRNNADFVVLETGLGGNFDATNVISKPLVSIITSIGYDHMHILGNTLPEIANQKAGIIKENSNTVIFESSADVENVFIKKCEEMKNTLYIVSAKDVSNYSYDDNLQYFNYKDIKNLSINLKGRVQVHNACLCIETMMILNKMGYNVSEENMKEGLKTVIHKGRMEKLCEKPLIIFDGAHNLPAVQNLQDMVKMYYEKNEKTYIISILQRKDYSKMLELLAEDKNAYFVLTSGNDSTRYASSDQLYDIMKKFVPQERLIKKDLGDAVNDAIFGIKDRVNFIVGSFYVYGTVEDIIKKCKK